MEKTPNDTIFNLLLFFRGLLFFITEVLSIILFPTAFVMAYFAEKTGSVTTGTIAVCFFISPLIAFFFRHYYNNLIIKFKPKEVTLQFDVN